MWAKFRSVQYLLGTKIYRNVFRGLIGVTTNDTSKKRQEDNTTTKSKSEVMATLETLKFDNLVLRSLPLDTIEDNYTRSVQGACFSRVKPTTVDRPETVAYSTEAMSLLDLPESELQRPVFSLYFSGSKILPGSETASHCYCGHQFGSFAGQLGDGAAIYLGEVINNSGQRWEVQLKGAGKTPYSRQADGRKVLRSSIREFLCSEAIHHLGIPTTRAGSCITSRSFVVRDIFYNGNPIMEKCSIVSRIAPTFIRFGSFEIFKTTDPLTGRSGPSVGRLDILKQLLDYTVSNFFPEINQMYANNDIAKYKAFYKEVVRRTACLVAGWQCVGFCHGVLNTDNMSIIGLTIDYGPFGFMDRYNPDHICNASDDGGRYTYQRQPEICLWNLLKLAEALAPCLPMEESVEELQTYKIEFEKAYLDQMRRKLGLMKQMDGDKELIEKFLNLLEAIGGDFTNSFRCLSLLSIPGCVDHSVSFGLTQQKILESCCTLEELQKGLVQTIDDTQLQFLMLLYNTQPELLEQIGKGKEVIDREMKRKKKQNDLQNLTPATKANTDKEKCTEWLSLYAERLQHEIDEGSLAEEKNKTRVALMDSNNPRFVLRNYIAQNAILLAEKGDYSEVRRVLDILKMPFSGDVQLPQAGTGQPVEDDGPLAGAQKERSHVSLNYKKIINYDSRPPEWACGLKVT